MLKATEEVQNWRELHQTQIWELSKILRHLSVILLQTLSLRGTLKLERISPSPNLRVEQNSKIPTAISLYMPSLTSPKLLQAQIWEFSKILRRLIVILLQTLSFRGTLKLERISPTSNPREFSKIIRCDIVDETVGGKDGIRTPSTSVLNESSTTCKLERSSSGGQRPKWPCSRPPRRELLRRLLLCCTHTQSQTRATCLLSDASEEEEQRDVVVEYKDYRWWTGQRKKSQGFRIQGWNLRTTYFKSMKNRRVFYCCVRREGVSVVKDGDEVREDVWVKNFWKIWSRNRLVRVNYWIVWGKV